MGVFFATCLFGTTIAPFVGGWITHYCSWRAMHGILGLLGLIAFTTIYFLFPETSQPGARGIDKMKAEQGSSPRSFVFINPLHSLWLLRSPTMLLISIIVFASMVSGFFVSDSIALHNWHSLSHKKRGDNWCLPSTFGHRKHGGGHHRRPYLRPNRNQMAQEA